MFKRKNVKSHSDDTQPIDYKRLAKEVAKEQKRQKANEQARGCLILVVILVVVVLAFESDDFLSFLSESPLVSPRATAVPVQPTVARQSFPQIEINSPLKDQAVSGSVNILGTVSSPDLRNYYVEFRPLSTKNKDQWFPATLPAINPRTDGVLGTWNTTTLRDGVYELRLNVNTGSGPTQRFHFGPVEVRNGSESPAAVATSTFADAAPTAMRNIPEYVCTDRQVNLRKGAGYSAFAINGQSQPGQSFKVVDEVDGESVQGNTKWYVVENGRTRSFVTALYTYSCRPTAVSDAPTAVPAEQATIAYITTCEDEDLLQRAQSTKEFRHNKVRRATAFCISKHIMVDLKVNGVFDTLDEAKREMFALLCALRRRDYGITFDVDGNFRDETGNELENRAVLARFETDVVNRINCDSYHGAINWQHAAEEWWVHRALTD